MTAPADVLGLINHEAERTVLAAMRDDSSIAVEVVEMLQPSDFYDTRRQVAFEAMTNLLRGPDLIDTPSIVAECRAVADTRGLKVKIDEDDIDSLDGEQVHAIRSAHLVRKLSWLRSASNFAFWMVEQVQVRPDPSELFTMAQEQWQHMAPPAANTNFVYGWDTVNLHRGIVQERVKDQKDGRLLRFDWPWQSWNQIVRPLRGGFVGVLAAADGMGKTSYLEEIAEYWASKELQVVYVHLEDALDYKLDRRLARHAKVSINVIEDGELTAKETDQVQQAQHSMSKWASYLHYYHAAGQSMAVILRELESKIREGICQAVVFDYLDKVQPTRSHAQLFGDNIWERQAADMEALKTFAERNNIPVLTATQGNKSMQEQGPQTRRAIQGSGQKSQKAQLVVILQRALVGDEGLRDRNGTLIAQPGEYSPIVTVRIDKQNRGQTGQLSQVLIGKWFSIRDMAGES